jgi:hypothetical protein
VIIHSEKAAAAAAESVSSMQLLLLSTIILQELLINYDNVPCNMLLLLQVTCMTLLSTSYLGISLVPWVPSMMV